MSPWRDFTLSNGIWLLPGGFQWNYPQVRPANVWYACTGIRSSSAGSTMITNTEAYYWASSPFSAGEGNSSHLGFSETFLNIDKSGSRAYALPVRCIRE